MSVYEKIGAKDELETIQQLADESSELHNNSRFPPEIIAAAKECLPLVEARATMERESEQLLRASSSNSFSNEELLRSATEQMTDQSAQLLRPAR